MTIGHYPQIVIVFRSLLLLGNDQGIRYDNGKRWRAARKGHESGHKLRNESSAVRSETDFRRKAAVLTHLGRSYAY